MISWKSFVATEDRAMIYNVIYVRETFLYYVQFIIRTFIHTTAYLEPAHSQRAEPSRVCTMSVIISAGIIVAELVI